MEVKNLVKKIQNLEFVTNRKVNDLFVGSYKSAFKGRGIEFADIREYDEGDDYRDIDWITSAKQQKLFVKTYHETRELTTLILVDLSSSMQFGSTGKTKKETALEVLTTLCFSALKNNDKIGALFFTDKVEQFIYPKKGQGQVWRILRQALLGFENHAFGASSNIEEALRFLNAAFPRRAISFLISDEFNPESLGVQRAFKVANKQHDFIFTRVSDPFEKAIDIRGVYSFEDPESGRKHVVDLTHSQTRRQFEIVRRAKEESMQKTLQQCGVEMVDIGTTESVYKKLFVFFKKRQYIVGQ